MQDLKKELIKKMNKKGVLGGLSNFAVGIVSLAILVSVSLTLLTNVRDTNTMNNTAWNATDKAIIGIAEYGNWYKILVIVAIAVAILFLVRMFGAGAGGTY